MYNKHVLPIFVFAGLNIMLGAGSKTLRVRHQISPRWLAVMEFACLTDIQSTTWARSDAMNTCRLHVA